MSFGDSEPDDALDASAPDADPEQVAIRLHEERVAIEGGRHWSELDENERAVARTIIARVVTWLRLQGTRL